MGKAAALRTLCLYGGTPYADQERVLVRGCDVVVGTPGRVKDHLERGTLNLSNLRHAECGRGTALRFEACKQVFS